MVKKLKTILILSLGLLLMASCVLFVSFASKAHADNTENFRIEGALFRVPASEEENFGIKFEAHLDFETYKTVKAQGASFGVFIVPTDLKDDAAQIKDVTGLAPVERNGEYVFSGAVYDILWPNVTRPFTAKAYYKIGNNYVFSDNGEWFSGRTLLTMTTQALVENSKQYAEYTERFNSIINYALNKGYVENNVTLSISDSKIVETGTTFTVDCSVKNGATGKNVLAAYPIVTITDNGGEPIDGVIELVGGTQNAYKIVKTAQNATIKIQLGTGENAIVKAFDGYSFINEKIVEGVSGAYGKNATTVVGNGVITSVTLKAPTSDLLTNKNNDTVSYLGFESGLGAGKTLAIDFTGKNMPVIGMFLDNAPEGTVIGGLKDAGTGLVYMNCNAQRDLGRLVAYGPNRFLTSDGPTEGSHRDGLGHYEGAAGGSESSEFGYKNLVAGTDYRLEIKILSADVATHSAKYTITLYKIENGAAAKVRSITKTCELEGINYDSTKFAFYGLTRPEFGNITFSYTIRDMEVFGTTETQSKIISGVYGKNATTVVENGEITSVTLKAPTSDLLTNKNNDTVSYLGFESGLGAGKTLAIDFTGKNMPVIGMFLDNAPEGTVIGGLKDAGTGLVYMNCNAQRDLGRLVAYGPNRFLTSDGPTEGSHRDGLGHYEGAAGGSESSEFGYKNLVAGTDYRLEIKILSADVATHSAKYTITLYKIENGAAATVRSITRMCTLEGINYNSTKFAFYGLTRPEFGDITFSYEIYDTVNG